MVGVLTKKSLASPSQTTTSSPNSHPSAPLTALSPELTEVTPPAARPTRWSPRSTQLQPAGGPDARARLTTGRVHIHLFSEVAMKARQSVLLDTTRHVQG